MRMAKALVLVSTALALLLAASGTRQAIAITWTTLDDPLANGSTSTFEGTSAFGIDGNNTVGDYVDTSSAHRGFLYNGSSFTPIDDPLAQIGGLPQGTPGNTEPTAISDNNVVGTYLVGSVDHGFLYNGSTYTTIDNPLGVNGTELNGIDGSNIVGIYIDSLNHGHGFLYNGSTFTTIDDPLAATGPHLGTGAFGISGNNIVGSYTDASGKGHAFLYNGSSFTPISPPGASSTLAWDIDGSNVSGYFGDSSNNWHAFLYNGSTYTTLDDPLAIQSTNPNLFGGTCGTAIDGNNVVGWFIDSTGRHGFIAQVPEPSSLILLCIGAMGVSLMTRGRSLKQKPYISRRRRR